MSDLLASIEHNGNVAKVTSSGELVVAPLKYSESSYQSLAVDDQVYNFYTPRTEKQFIITGILVFATKDVNDTTSTVIEIYEADSPSSATVSKVLLTFGMGKLTVISPTNLNILANSGAWINARVDDNTVNLNILGYYIRSL